MLAPLVMLVADCAEMMDPPLVDIPPLFTSAVSLNCDFSKWILNCVVFFYIDSV